MKPARASQLFEQHQRFVAGLILLHEFSCRKWKRSAGDMYFLMLFSRYGTMTAGELARRSGLTTGAVTGVIARLKKMKMIWTTFDPADRRKVILEPNRTRLTESMAAYNFAFRKDYEEMFKALSEPKAKMLTHYFEKGHELVDQYLNAPTPK